MFAGLTTERPLSQNRNLHELQLLPPRILRLLDGGPDLSNIQKVVKLFAFYFTETELARRLGPTELDQDAVWVPQDRTTMFRKLPHLVKGTPDVPRRCIFEVEGWLEKKPEFERFREAVYGEDYV